MAPLPTRYMLVSLPTSISPSNNHDEALTAIRATVTNDYGTVTPFNIPPFKVGTLDILVQQADELAKLATSCEGVVGKVGDTLRIILEADEEKIQQQKMVNDRPADQYLRTFSWNKVKYRADRPLGEVMDSLSKEISSIESDVKGKYDQYNQSRTLLSALSRQQTGNLSTRSLTPLVDPSVLVQESEYLETHLIAVPKVMVKEFSKSYESLSPMVVPRSATPLTSDAEFVLYAVTTFKKHSSEFVHKCRERRWIPREYERKEGGKEKEQKELERVGQEERKLRVEILRLARTGWGEAVMVWIHVLALRVFVETVLRYGLPLEFVAALVQTTPKAAKKARYALDGAYAYLGGNALARDKKGRVSTKDDAAMSNEMAAVGHMGGEVGADYTAYVLYEFEIN